MCDFQNKSIKAIHKIPQDTPWLSLTVISRLNPITWSHIMNNLVKLFISVSTTMQMAKHDSIKNGSIRLSKLSNKKNMNTDMRQFDKLLVQELLQFC